MALPRSVQTPLAATLLILSAALTGCGIDTSVGPQAVTSNGISGTIHGGSNPVVGATVSLYSTGSTGYGTATFLASTTSGQFGQFTFPTNTCVAGSEVYAVAAGGNTGANAVNSNAILLSALGPCANISSSTSLWLSELTTVAAAYSLSNFISISGSGASTVVSIGAPANNTATTPACTGTGSSMACTAGGIHHAFANALNLVNSVSINGAAPSGNAYTVTPSNANGSVPQALLNSIADSVQSCVNSSGGVSGDNPSTTCGKLFAYTTPPTTSTTSVVTPTNTLQALVNLAKYPTLTAANVKNFYNLATGITAFVPALTAAPTDFSLAIVYSGITVGTTTTNLGKVYPLALDYNDNVYAPTFATPSTVLAAFKSNGAGMYAYTDSTYTYPVFVATDTSSNAYLSNNRPSTGTVSDVLKVSSAGSLTSAISIGAPGYPYGVAVDKFNNIFVSSEASTANNPTVYQIPAGTTTATAVTNNGASYTTGPFSYDLAIDASGDVWTVPETSVANGGTTTSTLISNTAPTTATAAFGSAVTTTESSTVGAGYTVVFDSSGNGWVNNTSTLYKVPVTPKTVTAGTGTVVPTTVGAVSTGLPITAVVSTSTGSATITAAGVEFAGIDGANNIFLPNYTSASSALFEYLAGPATFVALQPCAAPGGATSCNAGTTAGTYPAIYNPSSAIVDSTGSIWVSDYTPTSVVQIIGTAVPAWPQLSYGHQGSTPQ